METDSEVKRERAMRFSFRRSFHRSMSMDRWMREAGVCEGAGEVKRRGAALATPAPAGSPDDAEGHQGDEATRGDDQRPEDLMLEPDGHDDRQHQGEDAEHLIERAAGEVAQEIDVP